MVLVVEVMIYEMDTTTRSNPCRRTLSTSILWRHAHHRHQSYHPTSRFLVHHHAVLIGPIKFSNACRSVAFKKVT